MTLKSPPAATGGPSTPRQTYYAYFNLVGRVRIDSGLPPGTVSRRLSYPEGDEHHEWFLRQYRCVLPYRVSAIETHDPMRCLNSTVKESVRAVEPLNSSSNAINRELLREASLVREFDLYIGQGRDEVFQDGMDSIFGLRVCDSVRKNGTMAVFAWGRILRKIDNAHETGEEILRQLGILDDPPTHNARLRLLTDSLQLPDPRIRDAAGLGISFLDDPAALPRLRSAYRQETETWVRRNLKMVIDHLEVTECPGFSE